MVHLGLTGFWSLSIVQYLKKKRRRHVYNHASETEHKLRISKKSLHYTLIKTHCTARSLNKEPSSFLYWNVMGMFLT
jgi:hypothetical protein